jgi:hypothetical protein
MFVHGSYGRPATLPTLCALGICTWGCRGRSGIRKVLYLVIVWIVADTYIMDQALDRFIYARLNLVYKRNRNALETLKEPCKVVGEAKFQHYKARANAVYGTLPAALHGT